MNEIIFLFFVKQILKYCWKIVTKSDKSYLKVKGSQNKFSAGVHLAEPECFIHINIYSFE